jgi:hypothetical protein
MSISDVVRDERACCEWLSIVSVVIAMRSVSFGIR